MSLVADTLPLSAQVPNLAGGPNPNFGPQPPVATAPQAAWNTGSIQPTAYHAPGTLPNNYGNTPSAYPAAYAQQLGYQPPGYPPASGYRQPNGYPQQAGYPPQYAFPAQGGYTQGSYPPGYVQQAAFPQPVYGPQSYGQFAPSGGYNGPLPANQGGAPNGGASQPGFQGGAPNGPGGQFQLPTTGGPAPVAPASLGDKIPLKEDAPVPIQHKVDAYVADIIGPEVRMNLRSGKGELIRLKSNVARVAITDPSVVEIIQYRPDEFELVGRAVGETTLTLWFPGQNDKGQQPFIRYLIKVLPTEDAENIPGVEYGKLQRRLNEMFPNSHIQLIAVLDKLIVRGQARDAREASQIMQVLRGQMTDQFGNTLGPGMTGWGGGIPGAGPVSWAGYGGFGNGGYNGVAYGTNGLARGRSASDMPATQVISMLDVPGEQQIMLKVRVAELTRTALREMGANFAAQAGDFTFSSVLNATGAASAILTSQQVQLTMSAVSSNRMSKVLAEPNLVTLNGYPASFIAGGQFPVPTVVGVGGAAAATTGFQGFGTQIFFTPTMIDKDHIRLQVTPTVSRLDSTSGVNGIPGLQTRSASTNVDLREGQWLAIAGLIQDQQVGESARVPWLGDIPFVGALFSHRKTTRDETEVIILVSPELIHPMEADQVPQILPGMEVTEPDDARFFIRGAYTGNPNLQHRSTVYPEYRWDTYDARNRAVRDARGANGYGRTERYYTGGASGFSN